MTEAHCKLNRPGLYQWAETEELPHGTKRLKLIVKLTGLASTNGLKLKSYRVELND
jgi:hypothetical protein